MSTNNINVEKDLIDNDPGMDIFLESVASASDVQSQSAGDEANPEDATEDTPEDKKDVVDEAKADAETPADDVDNPDDNVDQIDNKGGSGGSEFNLNEFLEQSSEGLFKSEDDYRASLSKIREYDELKAQNENFKAEKESIFANKEVETLNRLYKEGKTEEQIKEYLALSKMDLKQLSPKEILIHNEIKSGHTRRLAELIVERKYSLDKLSFDEDTLTTDELEQNKRELEIAEALMEVDANKVRQDLQEELSSLQTEVSHSDKLLMEAASKKAYKEKLAPFAEDLVSKFPKQLTIGDESTGVFSYDVDDNLLSSIKDSALDYFMDIEVTKESVDEFMTVQKSIWLYNNIKDILEKVNNHVSVATEKRIREEYENNQGLPKNTQGSLSKTVDINSQLLDIAREG